MNAEAASHPTIALLKNSSLVNVVHAELERMILSGQLVPGDKLTEFTIAAKLGISRGPLREAFRLLEEAGLVRIAKNRGVFVRDIAVDEAVEIFDLRAAMDELVGRKLALSITAVQLKEIRAMVETMEKAVKEKNTQQYHLLNLKFHDRLVELAGNSKLTTIYRKLIKELSLFRRLNLEDGRLMPISASEHRQIVKAIASGDADLSGKAMFEHVMDSKARTIAHNLRRQRSTENVPGAPSSRKKVPASDSVS